MEGRREGGMGGRFLDRKEEERRTVWIEWEGGRQGVGGREKEGR